MTEDSSPQCSICLELLSSSKVLTLECMHVFHEKCLSDYRNSVYFNSCCPLCRSPQNESIIPFQINNNHIEPESVRFQNFWELFILFNLLIFNIVTWQMYYLGIECFNWLFIINVVLSLLVLFYNIHVLIYVPTSTKIKFLMFTMEIILSISLLLIIIMTDYYLQSDDCIINDYKSRTIYIFTSILNGLSLLKIIFTQ